MVKVEDLELEKKTCAKFCERLVNVIITVTVYFTRSLAKADSKKSKSSPTSRNCSVRVRDLE